MSRVKITRVRWGSCTTCLTREVIGMPHENQLGITITWGYIKQPLALCKQTYAQTIEIQTIIDSLSFLERTNLQTRPVGYTLLPR